MLQLDLVSEILVRLSSLKPTALPRWPLKERRRNESSELEPKRTTATIEPVHVIAEGQDDFEHPLEPLAPLDLLGGLEHRLDLGLYLGEPDVELLLVVQRSQPLLVVGDPERRNGLRTSPQVQTLESCM